MAADYKCGTAKTRSLLERMSQLDRARLQRLRRAAKVGEIIFTREGVFESTACGVCNTHHKVAPFLRLQSPCPGRRKYTSENWATLTRSNQLKTHLNKRKAAFQNSIMTSDQTQGQSLPKIQNKLVGKGNDRPKTADEKQTKLAIPERIPRRRSFTVTTDQHSPRKPVQTLKVENIDYTSDGFSSVGQLGPSEFSDYECSGGEADHMKRQICREMYLQEEEALRLCLGRDREKYRDAIK